MLKRRRRAVRRVRQQHVARNTRRVETRSVNLKFLSKTALPSYSGNDPIQSLAVGRRNESNWRETKLDRTTKTIDAK